MEVSSSIAYPFGIDCPLQITIRSRIGISISDRHCPLQAGSLTLLVITVPSGGFLFMQTVIGPPGAVGTPVVPAPGGAPGAGSAPELPTADGGANCGAPFLVCAQTTSAANTQSAQNIIAIKFFIGGDPLRYDCSGRQSGYQVCKFKSSLSATSRTALFLPG